MLLSVTKEFSWDCAHMLSEHEGLCRNLHGHTYKMFVTLTQDSKDLICNGPASGMICDFKDLKNLINECVVDLYDHATVINMFSPDDCERALCRVLQEFDRKVLVVPFRPTAENMAMNIIERVAHILEDKPFQVTKVTLYETPTSYAEVERSFHE